MEIGRVYHIHLRFTRKRRKQSMNVNLVKIILIFIFVRSSKLKAHEKTAKNLAPRIGFFTFTITFNRRINAVLLIAEQLACLTTKSTRWTVDKKEKKFRFHFIRKFPNRSTTLGQLAILVLLWFVFLNLMAKLLDRKFCCLVPHRLTAKK